MTEQKPSTYVSNISLSEADNKAQKTKGKFQVD